MKKFSVIALALIAAMLFAVPAMAVDWDISGHYRARGFHMDNPSLNDNEGSSTAFMDMRLRLDNVLKVHDNLLVNFRWEGVDNFKWDTNDRSTSTGGATNDLASTSSKIERAWLTAKFDMFNLDVGRMAGGFCGLNFCDSERDADRIKLTLNNLDPFTLMFIYEKRDEDDTNSYNNTWKADGGADTIGAAGSDGDEADADYDNWAILGKWNQEAMEAGLLYVWYDDKTRTHESTAGGYAPGTGTTDGYEASFHLFDPWFKGTFGPITVEAEGQYFTGTYRDFENQAAGAAATNAGGSVAGRMDRDMNAMRYIIDVGMNMGQADFGIGYAFAQGQERVQTGSEDFTNAGFGGNDWEPLIVLTHSTANSNLGPNGAGNLNSGNTSLDTGMNIFYLYGSFAVMEDLTLNGIVAYAKADDTDNFEWAGSGGTPGDNPAQRYHNVDPEYGWEFDIGATWQIMDNLTYKAVFGYLAAGDFWKYGVRNDGTAVNTQVDDTFTLFHSLQVSF